MSTRKEFLNSFEVISKNYSSNICFYYISDLGSTLGVTYSELNKLSDQLSLYFSQIVRGKEEYIGVLFSDYFLLPSIILSIWKSGNIFAGIGSQYTIQNTLNFLNFLHIKYLITDKNEELFNGKKICQFWIENQAFFIWEREIQNEKEKLPEDICYGIMTSGTTGKNKVVQVPWPCILTNAKELSEEFDVKVSDSIFLASPCTFDPFFIELFLVLLNGSSLVIVSNHLKLDPKKLLQTLFVCDKEVTFAKKVSVHNNNNNEHNFFLDTKAVRRKSISILQMTPSVFTRWSSEEIKLILKSLRVLILGGEKFPKEILTLISCNTNIYNIYGITEISCWAFLNKINKLSSEIEISLGKPLKNICYIITENNELCIGSIARKCLIDDEKNVEAGRIVYRNTGDIVELKNNNLFYIGRSNLIYKKYGMKINLNKIEEVFAKSNNLISNFFGVYNEKKSKLILFFEPKDKTKFHKNCSIVTLDEFKKLGHKYPLGEIDEIEKPDVLVSVKNVPINSHGKCDRKKLLEFYQSIHENEFVGDLRDIFSKIWREALGLEKDDFSGNFVSLGGSSIAALEVINRLQDVGIVVSQNLIPTLLKDGNFEDCLSFLSVEKVPRKRIKLCNEEEEMLSMKWKFHLGKCVDATPTVVFFEGEERLIVGSHSSKLCCLDASNGIEIWSVNLGDRIESGFTFSENTIRGYIGCYDGFLYCISVVDGSCLWKYKTEDVVKSTPCVSSDGETVYVASYDRHLHCLSTSDGALIKKIKLSDGGIFASGVVSAIFSLFFIGTLNGTCVALDQKTNEIIWKTKLKSPVFASPCLLPKHSEIIFSEVLGIVYCLDSFTGTQVWSYQANGNIFSSPVSLNLDNMTLIFFGCHDGHLYCLQNKELKWKQQLESPVFARPSLIGSKGATDDLRVCAATTNGFVYLCQFTSGQIYFKIKINGELFSSPIYSCNKIFIGCRDNYVYSLQLKE